MIEGFDLLAEGHLAGDLTAEETRAFTAHLAICTDCRTRFEEHRAAADKLALLVSAPLAPMAPDFSDKVMRKLPPGPPPAAAPAAQLAAPLIAIAAGAAALVAAGAAAWVYQARSVPRPVASASSAAPAASSSVTPVAPTPLPSVARPRSSVGGLDNDSGGGATDR